MSYQVFARKYRPRTFDDVLGQDHVMRTLRNAITQNRLAHAYLFVGPRGTGKTSTARIFAKALNCPGGPMVDFDPDDELCVEIEKGNCLDVREIDGASNNGVEQVRELREEVKFAPTRCKYKIYYIDEVHMLSTAAFNALLKTLEEPPEHVKFIFATTEAHKVLPTIISRCQRFDLRRIPANLIAKHLLHIASLEGIALDEKAAYVIAKGAEGGMRDAQSMLDQLVAFCGDRIEEQDVLDIFGFTRGETVANLAVYILQRDTVGALKELHSQADSGKDLSRLLADLIQHFRTLLVHQVDPAAAEEDLSPELAEMIRAQSAVAEAESLLRVMDGLAEVDARMRWASNKLLHMEIGVIQAIQTLGEITLSEVIQAMGSGGTSDAPKRVLTPAAAALKPVVIAERPRATEQPAPRPAPVAQTKPVVAEVPPTPIAEAVPVIVEAVQTSAPAPVPVAAPAQISDLLFAPEPPPVVVAPPLELPIAKAPAPVVPASPPWQENDETSLFTPEPEPLPALELPDVEDPPVPPTEPPTGAEPAPEDFWKRFVDRVNQERPLVASTLEIGAMISCDEKLVTIGLPDTEAGGRDTLLRPTMKKFLEGIFSELLGRNVQIDVVLDSTLPPPPVTELSFSFDNFDTPKKPTEVKEEQKAAAKPAEESKAVVDENFYKDPLIQAALTKFNATLVAK